MHRKYHQLGHSHYIILKFKIILYYHSTRNPVLKIILKLHLYPSLLQLILILRYYLVYILINCSYPLWKRSNMPFSWLKTMLSRWTDSTCRGHKNLQIIYNFELMQTSSISLHSKQGQVRGEMKFIKKLTTFNQYQNKFQICYIYPDAEGEVQWKHPNVHSSFMI